MRMMKALTTVLFLCSASVFSQAVNTKAPDFSRKTIDGTQLNLSDFKGKVVLLDFWASWCGPCKKEFPFLMKVQENAKNQDFSIIAINLDTDAKKMLNFLKKQPRKPNFPVVMDPAGELPTKYNVEAMPTTILIDANGIIRYRHSGFVDSDKGKFVSEITSLIKESTVAE